jgi:type I restriction enzyme R subunit
VPAITPNETLTRTELIDSQLARAGWSKQRKMLLEEVLLTTSQNGIHDGVRHGITLYLLGGFGGTETTSSNPGGR